MPAWTDEGWRAGDHAALRRGAVDSSILNPKAGGARGPGLAELAAASIGVTAPTRRRRDRSVVIASGPGRPRLASLLTPVHVAIVRIGRLVDPIPALMATRPELVARG